MSRPGSLRVALAFAAGLLASPLVFHAYRAWANEPPKNPEEPARLTTADGPIQPMLGGFGVTVVQDTPPSRPSVVYVVPPVSAKAAKTWQKLQQTTAFNFPHETPLEDVLKYLRAVTQADDEKGLPFYVDPVSLQEAEKTMTSPVTLDLDEVSIATGLRLILTQLGLTFSVSEEGLVVIVDAGDDEHVTYPPARILSELAALRAEVGALKMLLPRGEFPGTRESRREARFAEIVKQVEAIHRAVTRDRQPPGSN